MIICLGRIKIFLSVVAFGLFIFSSNGSLANGAYGHLYVGQKAIENLGRSGSKYRDLHDMLVERINAYRNGLGFPDIAGKFKIGGKMASHLHSQTFFNNYLKRLMDGCNAKPTSCAPIKAHFFGALGHAISDTWHDRHFLNAVDRHCKKLINRSPKTCGGKNENLYGCYNSTKQPGAQHLTDVLIDFRLAAGIGALFAPKPTKSWAPSSSLVKILASGRKLISKNRINLAVSQYFTMVIEEPHAFSMKMGSQDKAQDFCPWAVNNFIKSKGGLNNTGNYVANRFKEVWDILAENKYIPKLIKKGKWATTEQWNVVKGHKL